MRVACLLAAAAVAVVSANVLNNGLHGSRGGDIVITHAEPVKGDALLIAVDSTRQDLAAAVGSNTPTEMHETEVGPLVAHVLGALPMSGDLPAQTKAFPSSTIFHKPRAGLVLMVNGLGQVSAEEFELANIQRMRMEQPTFSVTNTFEPRNPTAQITTLMTGELPSKHGVVDGAWLNSKSASVSAYDTQGSHAQVPNLADVVTHSFDDAVVVSLSGCAKLAAATAPHARTENKAFVFSVDSEAKTMRDSAPNSQLAPAPLHENDIAALLNADDSVLSAFKRDGGVVQFAGHQVTVQPFPRANPADTASFDLSLPADYKLFAELASVQRLLDLVKQGSIADTARTDAPNLFTITLVGLNKVANTYGSSDLRTRMAGHVVDAAIPQIIKSLGQSYANDIASQVVLTGSPTTVMSAEAQMDIEKALKDTIHPAMRFTATYPRIYVEESLSRKHVQELCAKAHAAASRHGLRAECVSELTRPILLQEKSQATAKQDDEDANKPTVSDVVLYQINLWVGLVLLFLLLGALYPLLYLDPTGGVFGSFLYAKKYV